MARMESKIKKTSKILEVEEEDGYNLHLSTEEEQFLLSALGPCAYIGVTKSGRNLSDIAYAIYCKLSAAVPRDYYFKSNNPVILYLPTKN